MKLSDRIIGFLRRFLSLYALHFLVCIAIGALVMSDSFTSEEFVKYFLPFIYMAVIAVVPTVFVYGFYFSDASKYEISRLDNFDRNLICKRFGGRYSSKLRRAVIDMHCYDFNDALESFKELDEENLNDAQRSVLAFYMGNCYNMMGYPSNGVKYFEQAIELGLGLDNTYMLAARCLVNSGRYDEAIEYYNVLLERDCYFDFIYTDMGIACLRKGDGEKALEYFTVSLNKGMNYAFALGGCSLAYLLLKNLEMSDEFFQKALRCNMNDLDGFRAFYSNIAESVGLSDMVSDKIKKPNNMENILK